MSGLVTLTSDNTAIPEFVIDGVSGFLTHSVDELAEKIIFLYENPDIFQKLSKTTHEWILQKAGIDQVKKKEIGIFEEIIKAKHN